MPPTDPISGKMVRKKETELAEDQAEAARNREDDGLNASKPPLQLVCCRPFSHKSTEFNQLDQSIFVGQMLFTNSRVARRWPSSGRTYWPPRSSSLRAFWQDLR